MSKDQRLQDILLLLESKRETATGLFVSTPATLQVAACALIFGKVAGPSDDLQVHVREASSRVPQFC